MKFEDAERDCRQEDKGTKRPHLGDREKGESSVVFGEPATEEPAGKADDPCSTSTECHIAIVSGSQQRQVGEREGIGDHEGGHGHPCPAYALMAGSQEGVEDVVGDLAEDAPQNGVLQGGSIFQD